jgi:hypothetical protein
MEERPIAFNYELAREVVAQDKDEAFAGALLKMRKAAAISFDQAASLGFFCYWSGEGLFVPVFYPEWPASAYLSTGCCRNSKNTLI